MKYPVTTKRFIAYFDIMGFKDLVYRSEHSAISHIMDRVSADVATVKRIERESLREDSGGRKADFHKGIVLPVMFSDSVLFVSRSNSIFDARKPAYAASFFLYRMLGAQIPVKVWRGLGTYMKI